MKRKHENGINCKRSWLNKRNPAPIVLEVSGGDSLDSTKQIITTI